ncbi:SGNH/GDSL hydrolase family protein [Pediococcus ethanolidurans]|uniref:GDSL-like Lipase/Acylhydrolase family n=1 Tax=Pediococcus ethanolidurans TaxID=319653 RepID=A0A0R2K118_9LACO|nr:SGNH/GDSL hydrolase family protein [Pediococcus ethanolidurans]KRN83187.1 hypothetical protein IV87_GL001218 [Pediococcus ethanolidurans]GEN95806.1 acyl-CoA thioesterase [Pediococcus ethanolidurans]SER32913.1 GDSL-like Lipase/Acylhydrolase family [Pediococcus ethanolidurans]
MKKFLLKTGMLAIGAIGIHKIPRPVKAFVLGNLPTYQPATETLNPSSLLYGKRIAFLGSSITYGAAAKGKSFVEYLQTKDGIIPTKSAISGTSLAGLEPKTYSSRLRTDFNVKSHYDLFVCQLSTNDGRAHKALGHITPSSQKNDFDRQTTIGAIEDTLSYVQAHFDCPVVFYTCVRKPDTDYEQLIKKLYQLQKKWQFSILDLWANPTLHHLNKSNPYLMMDDAHPTQMGYKQVWTPLFEAHLTKILANN